MGEPTGKEATSHCPSPFVDLGVSQAVAASPQALPRLQEGLGRAKVNGLLPRSLPSGQRGGRWSQTARGAGVGPGTGAKCRIRPPGRTHRVSRGGNGLPLEAHPEPCMHPRPEPGKHDGRAPKLPSLSGRLPARPPRTTAPLGAGLGARVPSGRPHAPALLPG